MVVNDKKKLTFSVKSRRRRLCGRLSAWACAMCAAAMSHADTYTFTNANGDGDLANPVNWGLEAWDAADSGTISGRSSVLSSDWTATSLTYQNGNTSARTWTLDLKGNRLTVDTLTSHTASTQNRFWLRLANGTVTVGATLSLERYGGFMFDDGVDASVAGITWGNANEAIEVRTNAVVTFTGNGSLLAANRQAPRLTINGGTVNAGSMKLMDATTGNALSPLFQVINGGKYVASDTVTTKLSPATSSTSFSTVTVTNGSFVSFGKGLNVERSPMNMTVEDSVVVCASSGISSGLSRQTIVFTDSVVTGKVSFSGGVYNGLFVTNGTHVGALSLEGKSNTVEVVNCASSGSVSFGEKGDGNAVILSGGSRTASGDNAISFGGNATNATLVIDNMTFTFNGQFNKDKSSTGGAWTGRPGCAIEFRGAAPRLHVTGSGSTYADWISGTMSDADLTDPVRLRYVLPETPYATAPLYHYNSSYTQTHFLQLGCNTVLEFDLTNLVRKPGTQRIPVVYSGNGATSGVNMSYRLDKRLDLDGLNRRMLVKGTRWSDTPSLETSADGRTLYLVVKGTARGTNIIFR